LSFRDDGDNTATLNLTSDCVQQLVMTLPHLLSNSLQAQHGNASLRVVFPLGDWRLETAAGATNLILPLKTADGFEVSFSVSALELAQISAAVDGREPQYDPERNHLVS